MKNMKKMASLMLVVVMVFSLAATAFAAETRAVDRDTNLPEFYASSTIVGEAPVLNTNVTNTNGLVLELNNAVKGAEYRLYKVMDIVAYYEDDPATTDVNEFSVMYKLHENNYTTTGINGSDATIRHDWTGFVLPGESNGVINVDNEGYVTLVKDAEAATLGEYARNHALGYQPGVPADQWSSRVDPIQAIVATSEKESVDGEIILTKVEFTNLDVGYYMITSSVGTNPTLINVLNPDDQAGAKTVALGKNTVLVTEKEVQEDSTLEWGETNDADVGQVVDFRSSIITQKGVEDDESLGAVNYEYKDQMDAGLTFDPESVVVYYSNDVISKDAEGNYVKPYPALDETNAKKLTAGTDYVLMVRNTDPTAPTQEEFKDCQCTFHIDFTQSFLDTMKADHVIQIQYEATINENAVIRDAEGNPILDPQTNKSKVRYGKGGSHETEWEYTETYVWDFNVVKFDAGDASKLLPGAAFVLYRVNDDGNYEYAVFEAVGENDVVEYYLFSQWLEGVEPTAAVPAAATEMVTGANGDIKIMGLDADKTGTSYFLKETKAPPSYNLLTGPVEVILTAKDGTPSTGDNVIPLEGTVQAPDALDENENGNRDEVIEMADKTAKVANKQGVILPETGGMGTTMFYILGGLMTLGAAVLLITKRRMAA